MSEPEIKSRNGLYGFEMRELDLRRSAAGKEKCFDIKQLWQLSHEIINLKAMGWKSVNIARILNCSVDTVKNTVNSTLGEHKLSEIRKARDDDAKEIQERIRYLTNKALDVYDEIYNASDEEVPKMEKFKAAQAMINDVSGLKAPTRVQTSSVSYTLTEEEIESFKQRGKAAIEEVANGEIINELTEETTE